jgi:hypothetical protein
MYTFNEHVLHKKTGGKMDALQFREDLTERIIVKYNPGLAGAPVKHDRKSNKEDPLLLVERHFPMHVPATQKSGMQQGGV